MWYEVGVEEVLLRSSPKAMDHGRRKNALSTKRALPMCSFSFVFSLLVIDDLRRDFVNAKSFDGNRFT